MSRAIEAPGAASAAPGEASQGQTVAAEPWIAVVSHHDATGLLREAYDWQAARLGTPTEFTMLGSLHPPLVLERLRLYKTVEEVPSGLAPRERQLAAFVTSVLNQTAYCASGAHLKLLASGLDAALLDQIAAALDGIRTGLTAANLPPMEPRLAALVRYAVVLVLRPGAVTRSDLEDLRAVGLDDLEILDLNDIVAYYCYVNRVANGLGLRHPITDPNEALNALPR